MKLLTKLKVITLLILLTVIVACSSHSQVIVKNRQCAVPNKVQLKVLDKNLHIGSKENVAVLMLTIADLVAYIKNLEASVRCFENKKK